MFYLDRITVPCGGVDTDDFLVDGDLMKCFVTFTHQRSLSCATADACRLTYTGSVNEVNAADYASLKDVEGFVVGRAGLEMTKLKSIIHTLATSSQ